MNFDPNIAGAMMDMAKEPVDKILGPPSQRIGQFLHDVLDYWMIPFQIKHKKRKIFAQHVIEQYRKKIEDCFKEIPEEERIPPRKSMLLSVLEASENFIEEEEQCKMFAWLAAATFDARKASKVHPAFVEIIKQLSPFDVKMLMLSYPILFVQLGFKSIDDDMLPEIKGFRDLWCGEMPYEDKEERTLQQLSMLNLERLGLVEINDYNSFPDTALFISRDHYKPLENQLKERYQRQYRRSEATDARYELHVLRKYVVQSLLGRDFCSVCLPEERK